VTGRRSRRSRGGKGGAEPRQQVRAREIQVLEYLQAGCSQHQIAAALSISQPAVSKIVRRIEERLLADLAYRTERQRARQTLQLEAIFRTAMRAWEASQQDSLRKRQRKSENGAGDHGVTVAELVSENRHGDPRYLAEARAALKDLRGVWGVDAPERVTIGALMPFATMSDEALEAELSRQTRLLDIASSVIRSPQESSTQEPIEVKREETD
jgi:DNA-binding CsgD family transcriptional regulator